MDLSIDLGRLRVQGARPRASEAAFVARELEEADLAALDLPRATGQAPPLQRLRDSHHALARLLASGLRPVDASAVTGYGQDRIATLLADPSFRSLVDHYHQNEDRILTDVYARMELLGLDTIQELHARLEEKPEEFSNKQLLDVLTKMLDRTGHAPVAKSVNVNVDVAGRLGRARQRLESVEEAEVVDG